MLKRTLACALLVMTGHAYSADIQVTTLLDEKNYTGCSLRNAVEFLNKRSQKEYENGYQGCGDKTSSNTIILQRDKEYTLNSAIHIKAGMAIMTAASGSFNDNQKGMHNATIKMAGNDRLFVINDESVEETLLPVILVELNLKGSGYKVTDGGLILNREALSIQYSRLLGGNAVRGGAIYNAGTVTDEQKTASILTISNSLLEGNKADQGAVIYSEMPLYLITQSVIRDNEGTQGENGALLYSQTGFTDKTTAKALASRVSGLRNSTVFHNKGGYVANIREGMLLNNVTIIKNAAGLFLQAPKIDVSTTEDGETTTTKESSAYISNSIIVANEANNCASSADDEAVIQSNLTTSECNRNAPNESPNFFIGNNKLIAGGTNDEGECAAPPADGLLCPYYTPKDQMLGYFKPRLLMSYTQLSDSLIVDKGRIYSDGTTAGFAKSCEGSDQRGKSRSGYDELCDLGAIELIINRAEVPIAGEDILYGQIAKFSIADSLLDGELLDPASCEKILGKRVDDQPWQPGCLVIQQRQTPSKGKLTLDQQGNVIYVPNGNWHGSDEFNLRIMTTTTRLGDKANYYFTIPTTIVQSPPNNFQSKTVNVGGGSFGISAIFALFGLIGLRRFKS